MSTALATDSDAPFIDLRRSLSRPRSQGWERNTCNAFAATSLAEFLLWNHSQEGKYAGTFLSEEYSYWMGRKLLGADANLRSLYEAAPGEGPVDGLPAFLAVEGLQDGLVAQEAWRYKPASPCKQSRARTSTSKDCWVYSPPERLPHLPWALQPIYISRTEIARFLVEKRTPVLMNIDWYDGLLDDQGRVSMPNAQQVKLCETKQKGCSGHVILLVGYDGKTRTFIFRNSYGSNWGKDGYGEIPEEYVVKYCEACKALKKGRDLKSWQKAFYEKVAKGVSARLIALP